MNEHANSLRRLFVAQAVSSSKQADLHPATSQGPRSSPLQAREGSRWTGIRLLAQFGLCVLLLSGLLSLAIVPLVKLLWVQALRRCVSVAAVISLWLFIAQIQHRSLRSYGLSLDREGRRQVAVGLLLGCAALAIMLGIGLASGACRIDITPDTARLWCTVLGFLPAMLLVGLIEELVFRGFILQNLLAASRPFAMLVSSALYAVVHLKLTTLTLETWLELGGLFLLGGFLAACYVLTGRLSLAIGIHAVLAYGARVNKLFLQFTNPDLSWLVGTSRLINGLASWVALLVVGAMIVGWVKLSQQGGGRHERA